MELVSIYRDDDISLINCQSLAIVGVKTGNDRLYRELNSNTDRIANSGISSLQSIGDCLAPGAIVHAVYSGHECARNIEAPDEMKPFALERPRLS